MVFPALILTGLVWLHWTRNPRLLERLVLLAGMVAVTLEFVLLTASGHPWALPRIVELNIVVVFVCALDDDLVTDTIAYAINDGGVLADHIEPAEEGESVIRWRVSHVSSDVLKLLRRLNAKLPAGSVLTTEDGMRFTVSAEGLITDGDLSYTSMSELGVSFVLEAHHGSI